MEQIFSFVIPLLFILGETLTISIIFTKKFEHTLPFAIIGSVLITYIFGFIDMRIGLVLSVILALFSIPLLGWSRKRGSYSVKELFFTNLFWVFLVIYFLVFILNLGKKFIKWDEFSHWGIMIKEMLRLDRYYYVKESVLEYHKEYPPFATIWEYIWCRLCGNYKERHLYNAMVVMALSLLLPVYSWMIDKVVRLKNKLEKGLYFFFTIVFIMLLPLVVTVGEAALYRTIYTEYLLIMMFVCGCFSMFMEDEDGKWFLYRNVMLLTGVLLVKQMGIFFYALLLFVYIIQCCVKRQKKFLRKMSVFIVIPLSAWSVWNIVSKKVGLSGGQFAFSKFAPHNIISVVTGSGENYQYVTIRNYLNALVEKSLTGKMLGVSYGGMILLLFAFGVIICFLEKDKSNKRFILTGNGCFVIGLILYAMAMLVLYLFGFSQSESINLACYSRYMNTYVCPMIMVNEIVLLNVLCKRYKERSMEACLIFIVIMIVGVIPVESLKMELTPGVFYDGNITSVYMRDCEIINHYTSEDSEIFLVSQEDSGSTRNIVAYETHPRKIFKITSLGEAYSDTDLYTTNLTLNEFSEYLKMCDYLFLVRIDEQFIDTYGEIFERNEVIEAQQLYKINFSGQKILLDRVY